MGQNWEQGKLTATEAPRLGAPRLSWIEQFNASTFHLKFPIFFTEKHWTSLGFRHKKLNGSIFEVNSSTVFNGELFFDMEVEHFEH